MNSEQYCDGITRKASLFYLNRPVNTWPLRFRKCKLIRSRNRLQIFPRPLLIGHRTCSSLACLREVVISPSVKSPDRIWQVTLTSGGEFARRRKWKLANPLRLPPPKGGGIAAYKNCFGFIIRRYFANPQNVHFGTRARQTQA